MVQPNSKALLLKQSNLLKVVENEVEDLSEEETSEFGDGTVDETDVSSDDVSSHVLPGDVVLTGESLHHESRLGVYRRRPKDIGGRATYECRRRCGTESFIW